MMHNYDEARKRAYGERTVTDGKPYYCAECGLGWGEYIACELPTCRLETAASAAKRYIAVEPYPPEIGDYSDIMEE